MIRASCGLRSWMQQLTLWQRGRNAQENIVNPAQVVTRRRGAFKKLLGTRPMLWPSSWPTTSESPRRTGLETVLERREEGYLFRYGIAAIEGPVGKPRPRLQRSAAAGPRGRQPR